MQIPMFMPESSWTPPKISDLPSWAGFKRIAIDTETYDPYLKDLGISVRRGGYIVGISFTIEDTGQSFYLPYRHAGGDNLPVEEVLNYMRLAAVAFTGQLVGANLSYDLDYLAHDGIIFKNVSFFRDIQIADPLIYELHMSYSLDNISKRYNLGQKDETALIEAAHSFGVHPKSGMHKLPAKYVGVYAEQDTKLPLLVLRQQEILIEKYNLWDVWNLESKVLPVLVKMRRRGVKIDLDKLSQIENWSRMQEINEVHELKRITGYDIGFNNCWKVEPIAAAFKAVGITLGKTKTGKPNIDKQMLETSTHPAAACVLKIRKVSKLRTTFADSIRRYMTDGNRIHCTFNQIARETEGGDQKGARYGRLSSTDPNLQQQPSRDEFAKMWRSIYIPEDGKLWACCDYSQQEPRWTTHFAAQIGLPLADIAADKYKNDPTTDNHTMMAELTGLPRKQAKNIFLGLCYGEGGAKLCGELGLPTRYRVTKITNRNREYEYYNLMHDALAGINLHDGEAYYNECAGEEGQNILDQFDSRVPYIRQLAMRVEKAAKSRGFIRTAGGRRLNFLQKPNGSYDYTHKALNRLIQGSSADQTKTAMVAIDKEMPDTFLQLQVHDEMDASVADKYEALRMAEIMRDCMPSEKVSFKVDVEIGKNWGEIYEI